MTDSLMVNMWVSDDAIGVHGRKGVRLGLEEKVLYEAFCFLPLKS